MRVLLTIYDFECRLFQLVNNHFENKHLNLLFRNITHMGGATFTILTVLSLIIFSSNDARIVALACALSLSISHLPVFLIKKFYPRKRPYLALKSVRFPSNPLRDHSFPSGHTTAIFSILIPYILYLPSLSLVLIPIGLLVGISRVYLGLHYPSDVMAGGLLGSMVGGVCFTLLM
ncbi:phosphatase PAP2 family protein [Cytobacillus sp. FJAT-54145]|uniref:Phosphatase PAP2 family protein n=1 Tax=Cytobacillus spartinae TaxID=3299023 RepID=A0ABW6KAT6_9BACI